MPLWVMIVTPIGVIAIVLLTWWFGGLYREPITHEWLERFFGSEEPPLRMSASTISDDGRAALALLGSGELAVVTRVGDGLAWRPLVEPARITRTERGFRIWLRLPTFPTILFEKGHNALPPAIEEAVCRFMEE